MIPSANSAIRPRPPPENRFSRPRMLFPPKFCWIASTAEEFTPGAGMCVPRRYSARIAAVNRILPRMSRTLNAPRIVAIIACPSLLDQLARPAGALDLLARGLAEAVRVDRQRLGELALGEHLDGNLLAGGETLGVHRLKRNGRARLEASLEVEQIDRLGLRAKRLERHRLLHVRAAQLAHPHVNRVLATLEPGALLGAGTRPVALLSAAGGLAGARALTATDALARASRAGRRGQVVEPDALFALVRIHAHDSSTSTRWRTLWSMPLIWGVSLTSTVCPIRRSPSERSVSSCRLSEPLRDLRCVTFRAVMSRQYRRPAHRALGPLQPPRCHSSQAREPRAPR